MTSQSVTLCDNDCSEEKRDMYILISFCILFFIGSIILFSIKSKSIVDIKFIPII